MKQWLPLLAAGVTGPILFDSPVVAQGTGPTPAHDPFDDGCGSLSAAPCVAVDVVGTAN